MSRTDLHPDHLLARRRAGHLSPEEVATLEQHAARCATCAFEIAAGQDFDRDLAAPIDPAALAAVTADVRRHLDAVSTAGVPRRQNRPLLIGVAAAVAVMAATALAAALNDPRPTPPPPSPRRPPPAEAVIVSPQAAHSAGTAMAAPTAAAPIAAVPSSPAPVETSATARSHHGRSAVAVAAPSRAVGADARVLFEQAIAARRGGQHALAVTLFERLQHRYGDTEEASISQIALGRLWLDRLNHPARALAQFESYLAARGRGESREDAMVGRAAALERLGRTASAREAWEAVRDAFPGSVSARRAAVRIDALR